MDLIHGGAVLDQALANMYTEMLQICHIPPNMNMGFIRTKHKGGKKHNDEPNKYRAITLTSFIHWNAGIKCYVRA